MKRTLSVLALVAACLGWVVFTACNQAVIQTPIRSFDRPSDVALACAQFDGTSHYNVRPIGDCDPTAPIATSFPDMGLSQAPTYGPNPNTPFLVALVAQSARGEVAFVDTWQDRVIDTDPRKPSYGFVPVGALPEHIRTTPDSCYAFTANVDSCDIARLDIEGIVEGSVPRAPHSDMSGVNPDDLVSGVQRFTVTNANGVPVQARPAWIEIAPDNPGASRVPSATQPNRNPNVCSTSPKQRAWVAYPGCQLVAEVEFPSAGSSKATIVGGVQVTQTGSKVLSGADLAGISCPVECAGSITDGGSSVIPGAPLPDLGVGATPTTQAAPAAIAFDPAGTRMIIGDNWGKRIDIIPLAAGTPTATDATPPSVLGTPHSVTLDGNALGVKVLRVSPRSEAGEFLYAVARDATVRVIDLDRELECETNPDPRWKSASIDLQHVPADPKDPFNTPTNYARQVGCFPVGVAGTPRRSSLAHTPGLELTPGQLPVDVSFVHVDRPNTTTISNPSGPLAAGPGVLVGDFVWIFTSDGRGSVVQLFDDCPQPNQWDNTRPNGPFGDFQTCDQRNLQWSVPQTQVQLGHPQPLVLDRIAHRFRGGHSRFQVPTSVSDPIGQPRLIDELSPFGQSVPPTSATVDGGTFDAGTGLPGLSFENVDPALIQPTLLNADTVPSRFIRFPDPDHVKTEVWAASWEGTIPGTDRPLGALSVDATNKVGQVGDSGGAYCARGVLAGDKMVVKGCVVDSDCDQAGFKLPGSNDVLHYQCIRDPGAPVDVTNGLCLFTGGNTYTADYWSTQCGVLLRSQRKYRITSAKQGANGATMPGGPPIVDTLKVTEIYEPEFVEQTHDCTKNEDCLDVLLTQSDGRVRSASCLLDADGTSKRCMFDCDLDPKKPPAERATEPHTCGIDYECASTTLSTSLATAENPVTAGEGRCMRAPIDAALWQKCFPEVQDYEVHAGDAFLVGGTTSGYLWDVLPDASGECTVDTAQNEWARMHQSRVPLTPTLACTPNMKSPLDFMDADDPSVKPADPTMTPAIRNVCQMNSWAPGNVVAHYENPFFQVAIQTPTTNLGTAQRPLVPPDGFVLSWSVLGGGNVLTALLGVDIQAQLPRYSVVAPDRQTVYVIDEGKFPTAQGLRGQLFRLFTPTQTVDTTFIVR